MSRIDIDIESLSVRERLELAEQLWDSIAIGEPDVPVTPAQVEELDRRLDDLERDPDAGVPWKTARRHLEDRLKRGA